MLAVALGCGDEAPIADSAIMDGAADGGADVGVDIAPPEIPWLAEGVPPLMLAPCADGWREVLVDGVTECDPYPADGPGTCDAGEAHFAGEPACRPIGEPCPTGDYAVDLPTDGSVVYVNAAAAAGGDGSLAAPYAALSEVGWTTLATGTTVALGKGAYAGTLPVKEGVRVLGACVRDTRVTGTAGAARDVLTVLDGTGEALVRDLTLGASPKRGVSVREGRALVLDGVLIDHVLDVGLLILDAGTEVTLNDVVVRGTQPRASDGTFGRGINAEAGVALTATGLLVEDNHDIGLVVGSV
ncbi:MAG: hypothetical protein DRJ42_30415, partial [Deltaproteobacteria bacterium]